MLGPKALAAALIALLLVPVAGATPGNGNGKGRPSSSSVGNSGAKAKERPAQSERGQAKRSENAVRKLERRAAREAARRDAPDGPKHPNPAWICKFERQDMGDEAFAGLYGENEGRTNAFGKCVSQEARARDGVTAADQPAAPEPDDPADVDGSAREVPALTDALAFLRTFLQSMRELL